MYELQKKDKIDQFWFYRINQDRDSLSEQYGNLQQTCIRLNQEHK